MSEEKNTDKDEVKKGVPAAEAVAVETPADAAGADAKSKVRGKKQRHIPSGVVHVEASFNNTRVTISDLHGNVIAWSSAGRLGYKGSRKSTAYVAQQIGTDAARRAAVYGLREVEVRIKGPGAGREAAVRGVAAAGLEIAAIRDVTPVPHNGCRPPKRRRV